MKNWDDVVLVPEFDEQGVACYRLEGGEYEKKEIYQYDKQITLKEERQEGRKEGIKDEKYSIAKTLKQMNMDNESISKATGLPINEVEKL